MPRFTITKNGQTLGQIDACGDRIELGSENTCQVVIDDPSIAANQARFVRTSIAQHYRFEPVSFQPTLTANGITLSAPVEVTDGAIFGITEYLIRVDYLAGELVPLALPPSESPEAVFEASSSEPESVWPSAPDMEAGAMTEVQLRPVSPMNLYVPLVDPPRRRTIPTWGWILAGAGIVLIAGTLLLIAL